jgi:hypothetical protein
MKRLAPGLVVTAALAFLLGAAAPLALEAQDVTVSRAVVAAGVEDREPVGESDHFTADVERVYFYTVFEGDFPESQFEHVWLHDGEEVARVALSARGPRWRTWSSKAMIPEWTGEWTVRVVDSDGRELASATFRLGN